MEKIKNKYQVSKTLRFGLTQKEKRRKKGFVGEVYESHTELKDLTDFSVKKIRAEIKQGGNSGIPIEKIRQCLIVIRRYMNFWENIYYRCDQLSLDKDFYKKLSKKIGFEGFWHEENRKTDHRIKKPQARTIQLSELNKKDDHYKERKDYIVEFWESNINKAAERFKETESVFEKFEIAINANRDDNRPNEVEMRKMFLSLANIIYETLVPLCNGSISFPNIEKMQNNEENNNLRKFAADDEFRAGLLTQIEELKAYFEENGGNVHYCRATLNPKTVIKNPNSTDSSIADEVEKTGIERYLQNKQEIKNKIEKIKDKNLPLIERALLFKYKTVPAGVQFDLAKFLSVKLGKTEQELRTIIRCIGQIQSPAEDYAKSEDKKGFHLEQYPLKSAFDFAWESLAKAIYHKNVDFPQQQCKVFLEKNFDIKIDSNANFKLYAQLLYLRENLATLEHSKPTDPDTFEKNIRKLLDEINWSTIDKEKGSVYKNAISDWLKNKKAKDEKFGKVKQSIGLSRGRLKNKIKKFDDLTKDYKDIATQLGNAFAAMRDKITNAAELNKISHYATIIEDKNGDRYILLQKVTENEKPVGENWNKNGELKTYLVNSVTSAAISKMIRKIRTDELRKNEKMQSSITKLNEKQKEEKNINDWKNFIEEKRWDLEFKLDLKSKNFEQIKKEIDTKCYLFNTGYASQADIKQLVKEKDALLLPIINQDLASKDKIVRNQFSKDWQMIFSDNSQGYRLTPEFRISYRQPTSNYPQPEEKRYSRFQMIAHFLIDYIPQNNQYISTREQVELFKDETKQREAIEEFHKQLTPKTEAEQKAESLSALAAKFNNPNNKKQKNNASENKPDEKFYVFGIDRGQNELATLCVINQDKKIIGDFEIYIRKFNSEKKQWEHLKLENRHILDLSNLRVETTIVIDGKPEKKRVLVDLSEIKVKDKNGEYKNPDKMQTKMRHLAYIRKVQFQIQNNPEGVLDFLKKFKTKNETIYNLVDKENGEKGLISFYGAGNTNEDLPKDDIWKILQKFQELKNKTGDDNVKKEIKELIELEPVDNLKNGVVANMVGVIAYLLEKFDYQVYIALEDLTKPFNEDIKDGTTGVKGNYKGEGKRADVEKYAGLGLYNFFEMQLLKKLFRIQQENDNVLHLVPAFRAVKNYENLIAGKGKIKNQFGIVYFVDANSTSKTCPVCSSIPDKNNSNNKNAKGKKIINKKGNESVIWVERDKSNGNDIIRCYACGFDTTKNYSENPLKYIKSGDDNAAFIISTLGIKAYELAKTLVANK